MPDTTREQPTPQQSPERPQDPMQKERDDQESGRPVQLDPEKDQPGRGQPGQGQPGQGQPGQGQPGQQPGNPPQRDPQHAK